MAMTINSSPVLKGESARAFIEEADYSFNSDTEWINAEIGQIKETLYQRVRMEPFS